MIQVILIFLLISPTIQEQKGSLIEISLICEYKLFSPIISKLPSLCVLVYIVKTYKRDHESYISFLHVYMDDRLSSCSRNMTLVHNKPKNYPHALGSLPKNWVDIWSKLWVWDRLSFIKHGRKIGRCECDPKNHLSPGIKQNYPLCFRNQSNPPTTSSRYIAAITCDKL